MMWVNALAYECVCRSVGRFLFGGSAFHSKMDKGFTVQQNMDDRICVSYFCFGFHAFLPSVYIFEKANESIHLSKSLQNF